MGLSKAEALFLKNNARDFPFLQDGNFNITSPPTVRYNCIAWASGDDKRHCWPDSPYWPGGGPRSTTLAAFTMMFGTLGYVEADSGAVETGFEKIAIYIKGNQVTHAARQLTSGLWTSKLGKHVDISHTLKAIEGGSYGVVAKFFKRPTLTVTTPTVSQAKGA